MGLLNGTAFLQTWAIGNPAGTSTGIIANIDKFTLAMG